MSFDCGLYDQALVWLSDSLSGKVYKEIILLLPLMTLLLKVLDILRFEMRLQ